MDIYKIISFQWFKNLFKSKATDDYQSLINDGAVILDVRNQDEYEKGHIPNSILIPLPSLQDNLDRLKSLDQPIIAYCRSGRRSGIAVKILRKNNMEAYNGGGLNQMKNYFFE